MSPFAGLLALGIAQAAAGASAPPQAPVQDEVVAAVRAIDERFDEGLRELEALRLNSLAALAQNQLPGQAEAIYTAFFRATLASGLYLRAEPIAENLTRSGEASPTLLYLAHLINLLAEIDRGDYEASLTSVRQALALGGEGEGDGDDANPAAVAAALPTSVRVSLVETYYQRLIQAGQFEVARKALRLIAEGSSDPATRELAADRLARVERIGQPAPEIRGDDVDGNPVSLSEMKGDVVLVVFWASWSLPSAAEARLLDEIYDAYRDRGFRILGVNLDAMQEGVDDPSDVLRAVRRFLIEHNVRWPNVLNGREDRDYAAAYGVDEIPASFLVGRDGRIEQVDLNPSRLSSTIEEALGPRNRE